MFLGLRKKQKTVLLLMVLSVSMILCSQAPCSFAAHGVMGSDHGMEDMGDPSHFPPNGCVPGSCEILLSKNGPPLFKALEVFPNFSLIHSIELSGLLLHNTISNPLLSLNENDRFKSSVKLYKLHTSFLI